MDKPEKDGIQQELADLREQIDAMNAERAAAADEAADEAAGETAGDDEETEAGSAVGDELAAQFQELTDKLDKELRDTNPVTLLVVFALGIFVGRLLPR